jgi:hypothetical protein
VTPRVPVGKGGAEVVGVEAGGEGDVDDDVVVTDAS